MERASAKYYKVAQESSNAHPPTVLHHSPKTAASYYKNLDPKHYFVPPAIMPTEEVASSNQPLHADNYPWLLPPHCNPLPAYSHVPQDFISKKYFQMESYSSVFSNMTVPTDYIYQSAITPSHELCISHQRFIMDPRANVSKSTSSSRCYDGQNRQSGVQPLSTLPPTYDYRHLNSVSVDKIRETTGSLQKITNFEPCSSPASDTIKNKYGIRTEETSKNNKSYSSLNAKHFPTNDTEYKCSTKTLTSGNLNTEETSNGKKYSKVNSAHRTFLHSNECPSTENREARKRSIFSSAFKDTLCSENCSPAEDTLISQASVPITLTLQPQFPVYFTKGSIIELANGELKKVESLTTEDFTKSALQNSKIKIDQSIIVQMQVTSPTSVNVTFCVGKQNLQVTVETVIEHPFFVFHEGWSSCSPERTMIRYGLSCRKLAIGDACISLTQRVVNFQSN